MYTLPNQQAAATTDRNKTLRKTRNLAPFLGRKSPKVGLRYRGEGVSSLLALLEAAQRVNRERSGLQDILVRGMSTTH